MANSNGLASYNMATITDVKSFTVQAKETGHVSNIRMHQGTLKTREAIVKVTSSTHQTHNQRDPNSMQPFPLCKVPW
jgi:hypothetical protein